ALEMISEVKAKKILEGYRNNPPVDKKALAEIVVAVSRILLENPEIHSIDLNPVMAYPSGAIVADARIMLRKEQVAP
ncbi:MAG: acetyl-CoA synthetase, partial [Thermoprotei archaeon]